MTHSEPVLVAGDAKTRDAARPSGLDEAAFTELHRRVARPLWAYLRRMTGNSAQADDLLQEAFTRLLVQADPPVDEAAQRAWLFRVASNLAIDAMRRGRREVATESADELRLPAPSGPDRDPMLAREMGRAFGRLDVKERALLWLAYVEDATHRDIAGALGLREASVRVLLFRARKKLAGVWTRRQKERGR